MDDAPALTTEPDITPSVVQLRSRSWKGTAILAAIAFVGGLFAMAWLARNVTVPSWLGGTKAEQVQAPPAANPTAMPAPAAAPQMAAPAATEQIGSIEQRIAEASVAAENAAGNATSAEDLLIAFAVRRTIDRGDQLGYLESQLLRRFAGQPNAVNTIINGARKPMTLAILRLGLDQVNPALVSPDEGWFAAFGAEFTSFFTVRDKGTSSNTPPARLKRARQLLLGGQVEAALAEVVAMPRTEESISWIANAKHYIEVHKALDIIEAQVLQPVTARPLSNR